MKTVVRKSGLAPYLRTPYQLLLQNPYWWIRQTARMPLSKEVAGIEAHFWPDPRIQNYHEFQSERQYVKKIITNIGEEDVFYDIGANIGLYSYFIANSGANVVAFEPSPVPFEYLIKNSEFNKEINYNQLIISDNNGTVEFFIDENDKFGRMSSLKNSADDVSYESVTVKSRRLEKLVLEDDYPIPDILKIDVEGAEANVLDGIKNLPSLPHTIYCEIHHHRLGDFSSSGEDVYNLLKNNGYDIEVIQKRDDREFIKASIP